MKTIPAFFFDRDELHAKAVEYAKKFETATPFRHVVIDNFLPKEILRILIDEFPGPHQDNWQLHGPGRTRGTQDKEVEKLCISNERWFPDFTRHFFCQLNSITFLRFLEKLTGVEGIIPDASYNACGLHSTGRGGRLMIHTDVNRHPFAKRRVHQILNAILYINEDWHEEYGGHLELWNTERKCEHRISPIANRLVIFHTGTKSFHGHPVPLTCPVGRRRNSLAIYYYMLDRAFDTDYEGYQHSVNWIPTEKVDFNVVQSSLKMLVDFIASSTDAPILVRAQDILNFGILEGIPHAIDDTVYLTTFNWTKIKSGFSGVTTPNNLTPFMSASLQPQTGIMTQNSVTLLSDNEGKLYSCPGKEVERARRIAYTEHLIHRLPIIQKK